MYTIGGMVFYEYSIIQDKKKTRRLFTLDGFVKRMCLSADSQYLYYFNTSSNINRLNIGSQKEDTFLITPLLQKINFNYTDPRDVVDDGKGNIWITSQNGLLLTV